jgi:hypothetical protein
MEVYPSKPRESFPLRPVTEGKKEMLVDLKQRFETLRQQKTQLRGYL